MTHRKGSKPNHKGEQWTESQVERLENLAKRNTPTPLIADALGRTEGAIRSKTSEENISLKPINKSPYSRR
ncbi:hypothetical protein HYW54_00875 [Candidatus Gottesmanbacteria bacterium]|nr:hypothetical protein [Candidatus Gottesmanbacteria bacterium]